MHVKYIQDIINSQDDSKMKKLRDTLVETIDYLKDTDEDKYYEIEDELYEIVEGKRLNREKAEEWVSEMQPRAEWTFDETEKVRQEYNLDVPSIATFVLLNMGSSDFRESLGDPNENLDKYIKFAREWYYDEDATKSKDEKVYEYYKHIVM